MWYLSRNEGFEFDIYVMDLCDKVKPLTCQNLSSLSEELHERIENAIQDYIHDSDELDIDDYEANY